MMLLRDWEAITGFKARVKVRSSRLFSRVNGNVVKDRVSERFITIMDASFKALFAII